MNGGIKLRRILVRATLPALATALVLTGCGGSSNSSSSVAATSSASASSTASAKLSAFRACLKQHGVTIRPGQFGGSPRPRASFTPTAFPTGSARPRPSFSGAFAGRNSAAFKACAKYAPTGFGADGFGAGGFGADGFGAGGFGRTISSSALAAFKSCLSQNGVKVTGTTAAAVLAELRNSTGKTAKAVRTCRVLLQPTAPTPSPST
jgi:hypothetical protein